MKIVEKINRICSKYFVNTSPKKLEREKETEIENVEQLNTFPWLKNNPNFDFRTLLTDCPIIRHEIFNTETEKQQTETEGDRERDTAKQRETAKQQLRNMLAITNSMSTWLKMKLRTHAPSGKIDKTQTAETSENSMKYV